MNEDSFLELCEENGFNQAALDRFEEALNLIKEHLNKKRLSGDTFFEHNIRVGTILAELHTTPEVVEAGLLHHLHTYVSKEKIKQLFGDDVLALVLGEDEIDAIKAKNTQAEAETLRKILLTTIKDVRVIIIKLANKLDNLRTISALPPLEQERIAREVLEVYAPLAYRLGIEKIKNELEDLALKVLDPQEYNKVADFLAKNGTQKERDVSEAIRLIEEAAKTRVKIEEIKGRSKHIYSIYKKVHQKGKTLQELYDLVGIRVIVPEIKDCYTLLGILHENFEPLEGRLKDYIANPKPNLYRSIHTTIKITSGSNGNIVEVQIRTPEMDEFAEEGVAAHWKYKKISSEDSFEKKTAWLREILDLKEDQATQELLETAKIDVFGDTIYCYTP